MAIRAKAGTTHESHTLYQRALERIKRHRHRDALPLLAKALQIAPTDPFYLSYYGLCLAETREEFDDAIGLCERASRARPVDPIINVNLGKVYKMRGDYASAHKTFLKAWEDNKRHPAPATELFRLGIRRPLVIPFLPRSNWCNRYLGRLRARIERAILARRSF
jgi:tetratricopeptide (TPR) repeat protein